MIAVFRSAQKDGSCTEAGLVPTFGPNEFISRHMLAWRIKKDKARYISSYQLFTGRRCACHCSHHREWAGLLVGRGLGGGGTEQAEAITSSVCSVTTLALSVSGDLWRGITKTGAGRAVDVG